MVDPENGAMAFKTRDINCGGYFTYCHFLLSSSSNRKFDFLCLIPEKAWEVAVLWPRALPIVEGALCSLVSHVQQLFAQAYLRVKGNSSVYKPNY